MKTILSQAITSVQEAENFLTTLYNNGESFHPEDDAHDVIFPGTQPYIAECDKLNSLMEQCFALDFDPCEFLDNLISQ